MADRLVSQRRVCSYRPNDEMRAKLQAEADRNGRSLSKEVELRVAASFDQQDAMPSDLGALIQKAVADGIAAHEAAKRQDLIGRVVYGPNGSWVDASQNAVQVYRY